MLDVKRIRNNPESVENLLKRKNSELSIEGILKLDIGKREKLVKMEQMKSEHNIESEKVPLLKKEGRDITELVNNMKQLSEKIKLLEDDIKQIDSEINYQLLNIPNTPNPDIPIGKSDANNVVVRSWGEPTRFSFEPKAHWDLGRNLGILDFTRATKIAGSRFSIFKGSGARLERSISAFMLDKHTIDHGFTELAVPYIVNSESMYATGQLPKFEDDMFKLNKGDMYLIPTAEVPVTNICREEVLDEEQLPLYMVSCTPCFRAESGAKGRDTRGLIRNHQFDKVEMVIYSKPQESYEQLERMVFYAEEILQALKLPYRVVELCSGELGFSSAKTYDLEVWMPSYNRYVEISSCSNFEDYQARRANIKYRSKNRKKLEYIHTLNGSGLAVGRTFAAILENYQQMDGSVVIPEILRPYMLGKDIIIL